MRILSTLLLTTLLHGAGTSASDNTAVPAPVEKPLFANDEVLQLALTVDFDALCRPREVEDCDYTPSNLRYSSGNGDEKDIPVWIKIRGGWRALKDNCDVPPLFVRFSGDGMAGTPFAGQVMLPLTTHCQSSRAKVKGARGADYEQYVLKEFLGYRLYNQVTDKSLRVRLAKISYTDPVKPENIVKRYAFFTEHFNDLATRHKASWSFDKTYIAEKVDLTTWDELALFQFMIGNTDWSVVRERNTLLITGEDNRQYPVPYDLDLSGLVDAEYAGVSPRLGFYDPKQRYYLGFCHPETNFPARIATFIQHKDVMLAMPAGVPGISGKVRKTSRNYLSRFFKILESPGKMGKSIIKACHPWPPSPNDHTTPPDAQ